MNKKKLILPSLMALNLLLTISVIVFLLITHLGAGAATAEGGSETYTLYIGLNDKETHSQIIATDEARAIVDGICQKHVGGFTVSEAQGGWTDEAGEVVHENTLVYIFYDASDEQITAIMDEVLLALNQSTILVRRESVESYYYSGEK